MSLLHWLFRGKSLAHRACVLGGCAALVFLSCIAHGALSSSRTQRVLDGMMEKRAVTGKFWRVVALDPKSILITKYQRQMRLHWAGEEEVEAGDRISFVARRAVGAEEWRPVRVRVHGKAGFKYVLSYVAVAWAALSCLLYVRPNGNEMALNITERRRSCRTA